MTEWSPSRFFDDTRPVRPFALILLNQPLNWTAFKVVAEHAACTVCADGGANRLYRAGKDQTGPGLRPPDAIIGDMDSLQVHVENFFRHLRVPVLKDPDQYSTDLTKCLKWLRKNATHAHDEDGKLDVIILGGLGGRVDQGFSTMHHLYMAIGDQSLLKGEMYLLSEQSFSFVLEKGENTIRVDRDMFGENVGIVPITGPATISTAGLEWDVQDWKTEFGGQVSTSNHVKSDFIGIQTDSRVLFTIELAAHLTD